MIAVFSRSGGSPDLLNVQIRLLLENSPSNSEPSLPDWAFRFERQAIDLRISSSLAYPASTPSAMLVLSAPSRASRDEYRTLFVRGVFPSCSTTSSVPS